MSLRYANKKKTAARTAMDWSWPSFLQAVLHGSKQSLHPFISIGVGILRTTILWDMANLLGFTMGGKRN